MNVIKVRKDDLGIINDILTHHIDSVDKRQRYPILSQLENLLDDDRSYLFAAICNDTVAGYTLAYRFPSLYASEYLGLFV